jgi:ferredoxin
VPTIWFRTSDTKVSFEDGEEVNLLRVAIRHGAGVPFRCASGNCGTDRVLIEEGASNLSRVRPKERDRLGDDVAHGYRLTCQTYASGDVTLSWDPEQRGTDNDRLRRLWLDGEVAADRERAAAGDDQEDA